MTTEKWNEIKYLSNGCNLATMTPENKTRTLQVATITPEKEKTIDDASSVIECLDVELGSNATINESCRTKILTDFHDYLTRTTTRSLGYPANQECNKYVDLHPFLGFHLNNIGDPFKQCNYGFNSRKFEVAILNWFAQFWEIDKDEYWGYVTNGGTENNFKGLLLGRELFPDGILYTSKGSHYSIVKAVRMFRMSCQEIATLDSGEMDCTDLRAHLLLNKDKPAIINVTIGTTFKGGVDNLDLVLNTLKECGFPQSRFYIHCDAALSGLIIPFLQQVLVHTFKKSIGSIGISGHKFLASPMPCGVFMTRKNYVNLIHTDLESIFDTTISGSRNGHASLFMWCGLSRKGKEGLRYDVQKCVRNAKYLRDKLKSLGVSCMLNEMSIIVVFERPPDEEFIRYWELTCAGSMAHVVVMPHITIQMLDNFVDDLAEKRKNWYHEFGEIQSPCLAGDIGTSNCACCLHRKDWSEGRLTYH